MSFSVVSTDVTVLTIVPTDGQVTRRQLNDLGGEIVAHLPECRRVWWRTLATACLDNQWAVVNPAGGLDIVPGARPDASRIAAATYDPESRTLAVRFWGGATVVGNVDSGTVP